MNPSVNSSVLFIWNTGVAAIRKQENLALWKKTTSLLLQKEAISAEKTVWDELVEDLVRGT